MLLHRLDQALPRVGDLASACFELQFEIGAGLGSSSNARLRSGQMKLATSRSALRPFARQGHPPSPDEPPMPVVIARGWVRGENSTPRRAHVSRLTAMGLGRVQTRQNMAAAPPARTSSRSPENELQPNQTMSRATEVRARPNASMYRQNHRVSGINPRTIEGFASD